MMAATATAARAAVLLLFTTIPIPALGYKGRFQIGFRFIFNALTLCFAPGR